MAQYNSSADTLVNYHTEEGWISVNPEQIVSVLPESQGFMLTLTSGQVFRVTSRYGYSGKVQDE